MSPNSPITVVIAGARQVHRPAHDINASQWELVNLGKACTVVDLKSVSVQAFHAASQHSM